MEKEIIKNISKGLSSIIQRKIKVTIKALSDKINSLDLAGSLQKINCILRSQNFTILNPWIIHITSKSTHLLTYAMYIPCPSTLAPSAKVKLNPDQHDHKLKFSTPVPRLMSSLLAD